MPANEAIIIELRLAGAAAFQAQARGAAASVKDIGVAGGRAEKPTGRLGKAIGKVGPLAAGAAVGGGIMAAKFGVDAVKAFRESWKIGQQTAAAIKSTGGAAGVTAQQVSNLAGSLSQQTGIDDEAIQSGQNLLLTFTKIQNQAGKGNDIFNQSTKTLLDMSTALGTEPQQAAIQLGKALNDPVKGITALRRVGVSFDEGQQKRIKRFVDEGKTVQAQRLILRELNKEFGGSAKAQATNADRLKVAFGNLQENVGGLLAPALEKVSGWLLKLGPFFSKGGAGARAIGQALKALQPVFDAIAAAAKNFVWALRPIFQNAKYLIPVLKILAVVVGATLVITFRYLAIELRIIGTVIRILIRVIRIIVGAIRSLVNGVIALNRWLLKVDAAIKGAVVGAFHTLQSAASSAWRAIQRLAGAISGALSRAFSSAVGRARALVRGFLDLGKNIVRAIVDGIKSAPGAIVDAVKGLVPGGKIGKAVTGFLGLRQHGGIVQPRERATIVGERGPELATFRPGTRITPLRPSALSPVEPGSSSPHTTAQFFLDRRLIMTAVAQATSDQAARR